MTLDNEARAVADTSSLAAPAAQAASSAAPVAATGAAPGAPLAPGGGTFCSAQRVARFYARRGTWVLLAWLVVFGVCAATGTRFLSLLRGGSQLPPGSPIEAAMHAEARLFPPPPQGAAEASAVVVQRVRGGGGGGGGSGGISIVAAGGAAAAASRNFSAALALFCTSTGAEVVASVQGYWELLAVSPLLARVAARAVAPDNSTLATMVAFLPGASRDDVMRFVVKLAAWAPAQSSELLEVTTTGNLQINNEWSSALNADFVTTEGTVLPIAMAALGVKLRSYRHMGIALLNLIVTLLLSFAVLVPVAQKGVLDIDPSAMLIMASLGIALSFDYSLCALPFSRSKPRTAALLYCILTLALSAPPKP